MRKVVLSDAEFEEFKTDALDLIDSAERALLALDGGSDFNTEYDAVFRSFHNLKGTAGMLELNALQSHVHELETKLVQSKPLGRFAKDLIDHFLKGCDRVRQMFEGGYKALAEAQPSTTETEAATTAAAAPPPAPASNSELDRNSFNELWSECEDACDRISDILSQFAKRPAEPEQIGSIYREFHSIKGSAMLFGIADLAAVAHTLESALEGVRNGACQLAQTDIDVLFLAVDTTENLIQAYRSGDPANIAKLKSEVAKLHDLKLGQQTYMQKDTPMSDSAPVEPKTAACQASTKPQSSEEHGDSASTIRVHVGLLDRLMTLMGEMVLVRNQVLQYSSKSDDLGFLNLSQRLDVVTSEIQSEMMKTRMQPIGNILSKFQRLVRDLGRDLGKKIDLQLSGTETELDKTLLESVKDPLTHIIRNACDHGLETTAERAAAGKTETGTISVKSFHEGGQVIIEISDDGRGLHKDTLINKAVEKGLMTREKASTLSEREIFNIICLPGFSTAAKVTSISGRGVGMDVVRSNIEKIGGLVEIHSEYGHGTTIRLKIPLTLAIVPAMIISCENDRYAIPQLKLVELLRVDTQGNSPIENLQGKSVLHLRGNLLPLLDLKNFLGFHDGKPQAAMAETVNIVVLRAEGHMFGLIVDEIQDTADIVVKPLNGFLKTLNFYSGATVLGDGSVALILDVMGLAQRLLAADSTKLEEAARPKTDAQERFSTNEMQEFLLFTLNGSAKHAVPLDLVHRLEEFPRSEIEVSGGQRVMRYRDSILPIINLNEYFGYSKSGTEDGKEVVSVIVTRRDNRHYGIEVNEILDVLKTEAVIDDSHCDRVGLIGSFISDDEVVVAVDSMRILQDHIIKNPNHKRPQLKTAKESVHTIRLLYAEDNAFFRRHVCSILERAGYEVTTVQNGAEAIAKLESLPSGTFAGVLSDIEMPKMNGLQLAKQIRKRGEMKTLPLIALTTKAEPHQVQEGLDAGFDEYLEKLNGDDLLRSLSTLQTAKAS